MYYKVDATITGINTLKGLVRTANNTTKSIEGQLFEENGFKRIPQSKSVYYKMVGSEIAVVRTGQQGYKSVDYDYDEIPASNKARNAWAAREAKMIASNRNFMWRKD